MVETMFLLLVKNADFSFLGNDRYFAVLKDLPTLVETHKTLDKVVYYKVADIGQVLEVSNIKDIPGNSRPNFDQISNEPDVPGMLKSKRKPNDFTMDSGLTPPTVGIKEGLKESQLKVDPLDVNKMDSLFVELEGEVTKRERSAEEAHKPYVFEEIIDEEPYMEYWDEKTEIEQGKDNFLSSARKAYNLAYERYLKKNPHLKENKKNVDVISETNSPRKRKLSDSFDGLLDEEFDLDETTHLPKTMKSQDSERK